MIESYTNKEALKTALLPIVDAFADVVLAFDSYDRWQDQPKGLAEVCRVLKANGRFVVLKDGRLPNGEDAETGFISDLVEAGFKLVQQQQFQVDDVSFTQWICAIENCMQSDLHCKCAAHGSYCAYK